MERVLACLLCLLCALVLASSALARPVNIVLVVGDDWGGPYASAYRGIFKRKTPSDVVNTPNIDRLAREGVLFANAFNNAPTCTASRSSIFSGRYFFNTGAGAFLAGVWDPSIPTFPLLLHNAGYHIGYTHKTWSPGRPVAAPFGDNPTIYRYQRYGNAANHFSHRVTKLIQNGRTLRQAKEVVLNRVRANFEDFLVHRPLKQPFLYWFGPTNTHRIWEKGSGQTLWGINPDSLAGKLPAFVPDIKEYREDMADYLGEIQALDAYVGVLLEVLESHGELDKTLFIATGDNGPGFPRGKAQVYDYGVHAPLVARIPEAWGRRGRVVTDFTTLMDLAPTFFEIAGVPAPAGVEGRSLLNVMQSIKAGQVDCDRTSAITGLERHAGWAREGALPYPVRALHTKNFHYILNFAPERWPLCCPVITFESGRKSMLGGYLDVQPGMYWLVQTRLDPEAGRFYAWMFAKRPAEELYDLRVDPDEIDNVAQDPAYSTIRKQLRFRLIKNLVNHHDPRVVGSRKMFDMPPYVTPVKLECEDLPTDFMPYPVEE